MSCLLFLQHPPFAPCWLLFSRRLWKAEKPKEYTQKHRGKRGEEQKAALATLRISCSDCLLPGPVAPSCSWTPESSRGLKSYFCPGLSSATLLQYQHISKVFPTVLTYSTSEDGPWHLNEFLPSQTLDKSIGEKLWSSLRFITMCDCNVKWDFLSVQPSGHTFPFGLVRHMRCPLSCQNLLGKESFAQGTPLWPGPASISHSSKQTPIGLASLSPSFLLLTFRLKEKKKEWWIIQDRGDRIL